MVAVRPFKALMYDLEEAQGGWEQVTSLPYDVVTPEEVARLKKASEYNVTHLTVPAPAPGKGEKTKYQEANKLLKRWRKEGILFQQGKPAFYLYKVTYDDDDGTRRTARGLGCLVGLDPDYEMVRPHERTHKGPIEDRFELLKATSMDLEPIEFLYRDEGGEVMDALERAVEGSPPLLDFTEAEGVRHALWIVTDQATLEQVSSWFSDERVYIADGHHRYATALHYAAWRAAQDPGDAAQPRAWEHKLAVLMEAGDPGLTVKATHRLVRLGDKEAARGLLRGRFDTVPFSVPSDPESRAAAVLSRLGEAPPEAHRFVFDWGGDECDVVTVAEGDVLREAKPERSRAWRDLDVSVLHHLVLPAALGVTAENAGSRLRYTRDAVEAVRAGLSGEADCVVLMNATPQHAVLEVADALEHMPQKSTYFLPKLQSGLLFSPL